MKTFQNKLEEGMTNRKTVYDVKNLTPRDVKYLLGVTGTTDVGTLQAYDLDLVIELANKAHKEVMDKVLAVRRTYA